MPAEKIIVRPGGEQTLQDLAKGLLALADDPHDVEFSPHAGGYFVPETLAARYALEVGGAEQAEVATAAASTETAPKPAGRARKRTAKAAEPATAKTTTGRKRSRGKAPAGDTAPAAQETEGVPGA